MRTPLQKNETILLVTYTSWIAMAGPALIALAAVAGAFFLGFVDHFGWAVAMLGILFVAVRYLQ